MPFARLAHVSVFAVAAVISTATMAAATSYPAPPVEDQGFPDRNGDYEQAYVTTGVNVRSKPNVRSGVVNRLKQGDAVNVGECRADWCYVDAYGGDGWVSGRFIGRGENPYHPNRPAGPGIPPQHPDTNDRTPVGQY